MAVPVPVNMAGSAGDASGGKSSHGDATSDTNAVQDFAPDHLIRALTEAQVRHTTTSGGVHASLNNITCSVL